jgi:hypothetical protein
MRRGQALVSCDRHLGDLVDREMELMQSAAALDLDQPGVAV